MSLVKFLHISDLHISKTPQLRQILRRSPGNFYDAVRRGTYAASHSNGKLKALVDLVHSAGTLDAIVITGDIATTGLDYDLERALRFVEGQPDAHDIRTSSGFPTISGAGLPVFLLPGNHDRYKLLLRRLGYAPGSRKFHQIFSSYWQGDVRTNSIMKADLAVGVMAADFSLRTWRDAELLPNIVVNAYAQGKVYKDVLDELIAETDTFRMKYSDQKDVFIVWALHFPPASTHPEPHMKLIDSDLLISAANDCEVSLILSGHTHDPFDISSPRMAFRILGTGSTTQYESPEGNYCEIVSIENAPGGSWVETEHYQFDRASSKFVRT